MDCLKMTSIFEKNVGHLFCTTKGDSQNKWPVVVVVVDKDDTLVQLCVTFHCYGDPTGCIIQYILTFLVFYGGVKEEDRTEVIIRVFRVLYIMFITLAIPFSISFPTSYPSNEWKYFFSVWQHSIYQLNTIFDIIHLSYSHFLPDKSLSSIIKGIAITPDPYFR